MMETIHHFFGRSSLFEFECAPKGRVEHGFLGDVGDDGSGFVASENAGFGFVALAAEDADVAHNRRSTKHFKVDLKLRAPNYSEVKDIPRADATDKEIKELLAHLKPFEGKEFADLLHQCHNIIRNNEHLDPAAAFDEIAKILFVKVWVERRMKDRKKRKNRFTVEFLKSQFAKDPINSLFSETKEAYRTDKIFEEKAAAFGAVTKTSAGI